MNEKAMEFELAKMTHKGKMLAAIRGKSGYELPWAPRLDLWYKANKIAGTLPSKYKKSTLMEIVDDLDIGYHAIVPDFQDIRCQEDDADRAIGIYNIHTMPCRTILKNVKTRMKKEYDQTTVSYETPFGNINTKVIYNDQMRKAGITITHVEEYAFKTSEDYKALGYIFENAEVVPNYEGYQKFSKVIGERGIAAGFVNSSPSGMFFIQRELMPLNTFFYEMNDNHSELAELAEKINSYLDKAMIVAADSPAEVIFIGANYDSSVTYPPFFQKYILPSLKKYSQLLHSKGKFLLTHTDGENRGLLEHYLEAQIDIADSICPSPMTSLTFEHVRKEFHNKITIMGGIPSVALLPSSMTEKEFDNFIDDFFKQIGSGERLILGISDTTPPAASFERIIKIIERVRNFGMVGS
jgi:hypothetical protein